MVVAQEKDGVLYVDPTLSAGRKEWCADWAARMGWQLADAEQNPKLWAEMVEARRSERHATIRWHFGWEHYVLVSVPDGLTETSVYEFRVARVSDVARRFVKPVAVAQADLGGHFFGRSTKRVQICILKTDTISTLDEPVDPERAAETLRIFRNVDAGQPAAPPAAWKCQPGRCDYVATCTVRRQASPAR